MCNELVVLAVLPGETSSGLKPVIEDPTEHTGFPVIRYFYQPSKCRIASIASFINLVKYFINSFAGYRYVVKRYGSFDLIHVHVLTRTAVPAFLINLFTGTPYIISEHWTRYFPENWGFTGVIRRVLTRIIVRRAAAVTSVSDFLRSAMENCGLNNKRFVIIPNAIDTNLFSIAGNTNGTHRKRIIHVSNFHEKAKNIQGILRVIKVLREQRSDFDIVFIGGKEPCLCEAKKYASGLGLENPDVVFSGPLAADKLADAYRESVFLLMFSNFESFSIVIPEALSCGIPVLATAVGGIPEYFTPNAGRLISPGDEAALLENINFMLDNYQSFDPGKLRSITENKFGLATIGQQFDELYKLARKLT